jgi:tRNA U34 5-methylaminomethyl-2-thiouridine-forming methyltransferase MnmC
VSWVQSDDGSYTAYSPEYNEHYHSTKDGALHESLVKHVQPAFLLHATKEHLRIIDICFGLGFNTLATLYYRDTHFPNTTVEIFSPELNGELVASLVTFPYPDIFNYYLPIIASLVECGVYEDVKTKITVVITDARIAMRELLGSWDVCYQDAFSPTANPLLWTREYFADVARLMGDEGIVTTYSIALAIRMALHENGFNVYLNTGEGYRSATVASRRLLLALEKIDVEHKMKCNPDARSLRDDQASASE